MTIVKRTEAQSMTLVRRALQKAQDDGDITGFAVKQVEPHWIKCYVERHAARCVFVHKVGIADDGNEVMAVINATTTMLRPRDQSLFGA